jgi:protein ImuA
MSHPAQAIVAGRVSAAGIRPRLREGDRLAALRRRIAEIERRPSRLRATDRPCRWTLGVAPIDDRLPSQGLALNALHEIAAAAYPDTPAAMGFALSLAIRRLDLESEPRPLLWCALSRGNAEWGRLYGHGITALGLPRHRFLTLSLKTPRALLWAIEEALRSGTLSAVMAGLDSHGPSLALTRRLSLAAEQGSTPALLVFSRPVTGGTAALSRWQVKARASTPPLFDSHAPGLPAWALMLERCRAGRPGEWTVEWSHATHRFSLVAPVSGGTAEPCSEAAGSLAPERLWSGLRTC